ncbi:MAG TPA: hypothetical protein VFR81_21050, partial [Longimicrobium sp.]|nr:hypothetical protein [Longimicrobium sp.]
MYFVILGLIAFLITAMLGGAIPDVDTGDALRWINSPLRIANLMLTISMLAMLMTAAMAGNAVFRDFQTVSYPLFFTTPVRERTYLLGRWLGAVAASVVILLGAPLGMVAACMLPGIEPERVGPWRPEAFAVAFGVLLLPNLLLSSAIFLSAAALTRKMLANYVGGIVLFVGWAAGRMMLRAVDVGVAETLVDPFGGASLDYATRYWTITEQNVNAIPLDGAVLANRALWLAVGAGVMALCAAVFRFAHAPERQSRVPWDPAAAGVEEAAPLAVPAARRSFTADAHLRQLAAETRRGVREVVANFWFPVLVGLCLFLVAMTGSQIGSIYGTETYPVTYRVLEMLQGTFSLFLVIIIALYAGELVWHERELRAAGIHDSLPVPAWVPLLARFAALAAIVLVLLFVAMLCGMLIQASKGYFRFEIGLYLRGLFLHDLLLMYLPLIALAVLIQTLVNHKYVGHFVFLVWFIGQFVVYLLLGVRHNLAMYGSAPSLVYSDMNGFGHAIIGWRWFTLYWLG